MPEHARVHTDPDAVGSRLAELGLTRDALWSAVQEGYLARESCTQLDPPSFRGLTAWAVTTRALRKRLIPLGWTMSNAENFALTLSEFRSMAIVVATGDAGTGLMGASPRTNSEKGPKTLEAVAVNNQLDFFVTRQGSGSPERPLTTWILLISFEGLSIRAELSKPNGCDSEGHICEWQERVILTGPDGDTLPLRLPEAGPDFDVDVTRRSA